MKEIEIALQSGFIDKSIVSKKEYKPKLFYNNYKENMRLSYEIIQLLKECDTFDFSVAFIASSGLAVLKQVLLELKKQNKKGRIITSTYLGFNSPKTFKELLKFNNLDIRIYVGDGFHPKGYIFKQENYYKAIVGSSNITQSALTENQEWNIFFTSTYDGEVIFQIKKEFDRQWNNSIPLTLEWIEEYQKDYKTPTHYINKKKSENIKPNYMQKEALLSLKALRNEGKNKALLISATGTGKTYLSAFDVKECHPKRMLFVVHRKNIALKAMETFQTIIHDRTMGIFSGNKKELDKDYIFSTIQTIYKPENRKLFLSDEFDYIIIDEVHKAGAHSYQEFVKYFKPKFLLGMSATPERTDDFDIYKMFDYNIAFEIRLQQAMEYDLLCPFHYYGITDLLIDGKSIDDKSDFNQLVSHKRVDYIISKIQDYGYSGEKVRGLVFVSRKNEAIELSHLFNHRGYKTIPLTGSDSEEKRQEAMDRLESNGENALDYIFTVDIFNEGIDIPKVNQVVMLRPTQSAIIFVQQLGRGLRKNDEKDYVVVIDFIGNYENNFLIPIALSGNTNLNKDDLRKFMIEKDMILPGSSTVQFDEISQKRIFDSIDTTNFNTIKMIKESYFALKAKLGRIPKIEDFEKYGAIDIQKIFQNNSLGSYHEFLKKYDKDYHVHFSNIEEKYLIYISSKLSNGKRIQELEMIKLSIERKHQLMMHFKNKMLNEYHIDLPEVSYENIRNILTQNFMTGSSKEKFKNIPIIDKQWNISPAFNQLLDNNDFKNQIIEVLDYAINKYKMEYSERYNNTDFCLYKKYTYEDVCRLLNWEKKIVDLNMGGYFYDERTNTLPVFINYDKADSISETIKYADRFIDRETLIAMSKNNRRINSDDMKKFIYSKENKTDIHIFIRKNKDDSNSKEFYYLGLGYFVDIKQVEMAGKPICEILYKLDKPVRKDVYDFIVE